jgi:hypothetical protein
MGQYYKVIILADDKKNNNEVILLVITPREYDCGSKLMEHAYLNTQLLNTIEYLISKNGKFYKSRIVWAGDYADEEEDFNNEEYDKNDDEYDGPQNLYNYADNYSSFNGMFNLNMNNYKYIVNHSKKQYTNKYENSQNIHPLPLLVSEGNDRGGGDYSGYNKELCGSWSRDVISIEEEIPESYTKLDCNFSE